MVDERVIEGRAQARPAEINSVIRNTYMLLSLTLLFSGLTAGVSMAINPPMATGLICSLVAIGLLWFVLPRTAESAAGLGVIFLITGMLGFGLGPMLNHYVTGLANGGQLIMTALGGTGVIFLGLSAYAFTTRKDFSFMGGFLFVGILVAFLCGIGALIFQMPGMMLGISAMFILLMSGLILYQTSAIIHGGETNYIMATIGLYIALYNMFTSLLHLLAAFAGER
ncbi:MAG: Bax inhibitor-1/YccA family protein [Ectothiorhodospiraceae bacterium]